MKKVKCNNRKAKESETKILSPNSTLNTQNSPLPKGWVWVRLGEIVKIVYGKDLSIKQFKKSGYPVFGANGVIGFYDKYLYEEEQVLISCRGAYSGKINLSPPKSFITHNSLILEINDNFRLLKKFLFYILQSVDKSKLVTGTAQPQVTINNAINLELPLPPFTEQQRIVEEIERRFSVADEVEKAIDNSLKQAERLRQSILKKAFEGKLVPQDPNDEPAEKLLKRIMSFEL
jgi:type I restriction enzyme S subunit